MLSSAANGDEVLHLDEFSAIRTPKKWRRLQGSRYFLRRAMRPTSSRIKKASGIAKKVVRRIPAIAVTTAPPPSTHNAVTPLQSRFPRAHAAMIPGARFSHLRMAIFYRGARRFIYFRQLELRPSSGSSCRMHPLRRNRNVVHTRCPNKVGQTHTVGAVRILAYDSYVLKCVVCEYCSATVIVPFCTTFTRSPTLNSAAIIRVPPPSSIGIGYDSSSVKWR